MNATTFGVLFCQLVILCRPGCGFEEIKNLNQAMVYLAHYGYLSTALTNPIYIHCMSKKMFQDALIEYQKFVDIEPTGVLDEETLKAMNTQRCGCVDRFYKINEIRSKRFTRLPDGWRENDLKYRIVKYPTAALNKIQTDAEIKRAFDQWSEVTPLKFTQTHSELTQINVMFGSYNHGDYVLFDGKLGMFAHTLTPNRGNIHFDDSEIWTANSTLGTNLYQVALHEFGHMLGLDHSQVKFSVMRPLYPGYNSNYKLKNDDIEGIQEMYGERNLVENENNDSRAKRFKNNSIDIAPDICDNFKMDTILNLNKDDIFVFKNNYYWKLTNKGVDVGYPKLIDEKWKNLPGNIDAAFRNNNGKTYFFKGSKYWKFIENVLEKGYPKDIAKGFVGIPNNVDGAMAWYDSDKSYFFKGTTYWLYDASKIPPVASHYPKPLRKWKGSPQSIDAVLHTNNNVTIFFKDNHYYKFNDRTFSVDTAAIPPYPRRVDTFWYHCLPKTD